MIYFNDKGVAIMGQEGFIGQALAKRDLPEGVYFFDSPSSNVLFDEHLDYCMEQTINDFLKVLQYCRDHNKYLIYPSSATVYNKNTSYARCKAILEEMARCYPQVDSLGLRIAAGFGPGEAHKGRYASVIYQWCQQMKRGLQPAIFGDGTQTRDFVYEDDIADQIQKLATEHRTGIVDIGTGINTSFNQVVQIINEELGTDISPIHILKPKSYVQETLIHPVLQSQYDLRYGIKRILEQ